MTGLQLGYEARCAAPNAFDVMLGSQLGVGAYRALVEKRLDGVMVSVVGQLELRYVPFKNSSIRRRWSRWCATSIRIRFPQAGPISRNLRGVIGIDHRRCPRKLPSPLAGEGPGVRGSSADHFSITLTPTLSRRGRGRLAEATITRSACLSCSARRACAGRARRPFAARGPWL